MTGAQEKTLKWAAQVAIRVLGAAYISERVGLAEASVYRWANPNEPATTPTHHALILDRECWVRAGVAPFREVFENNAGAPIEHRLSAELVKLARQFAPVAGVAAE